MTSEPQARNRRRGLLRATLGWLAALAILALPLLGLRSTGAIKVYLDTDGVIEGEATTDKHEGEIEILGFSNWTVANSGAIRDGAGGGSGEASFSDIGLTKWVDKSSPILMLYCASGDHLNKARLQFVETTNKEERTVLEMEFEGIVVTSYEVGGSNDGVTDKLTDSFNLNFAKFTTTVHSYRDDGSPDKETYVTWDIAQNTGDGSGGSSSGGGGGGTTNTAPTISDVPNQVIDEDGSITVNFTVHDSQTADGSLSVTRGTANPLLLPLSGMTLGGSGGNRTITLTPAANESGSAQVTLRVSDGVYSRSDTFLLTINPVNDAPSISPLAAQTTEADTPLDIDVTLGDPDSSLDSVTLTGAADPPALVAGITDTTLTGSVRTLHIVPVPGTSGTATITLTATDDLADAAQTSFSFTVNPPAGSGPTAILLNGSDSATPAQLAENSPAGTEVGVLDAADTPGLAHTFMVLSDPGPFAIGGPDGDRLLVGDPSYFDYETNPSLLVTIQAADTVAPARTRTETFTVELTNVNEPALITAPANFPDAPPETDTALAGLSIDDPDAGSNPVSFAVTATDCTFTIDESGPLAGLVTGNGSAAVTVIAPQADLNAVLTAGGLTLRGDPGFEGTINLGFSTNDNGHTGSGTAQIGNAVSSIEIVLSSWEQWRRGHFIPAELADLLVSGFDADCDRDGLPNGAEYGFGTNPRDSSSGPDAADLSTWAIEGTTYPAVTFPRRISDPDFSVAVEVATDLQNWGSGLSFTEDVSITPAGADFEEVTVRTLLPQLLTPTQQLRIRFSLDAP